MVQKNSWLRRLATVGAYVVGIYLLVIALVVLAAPSLISTGVGTNFLLEKIINRKVPGKLSVDKISLGWFSPQSFENIELLDPEGELLVHIDHLETGTPLWKLLLTGGQLHQIEIKNMNASLDESLIKLIHKLKKLESSSQPLEKNSNPVILSSIDLNLNFNAQEDVYHLNTKGFVNYKKNQGSFFLEARVLAPKEDGCSYICENSFQSLQGELVDIPEIFFRRLLILKNPERLPSSPIPFIGDVVSAKISYDNTEDKDTLHLVVDTPTAKGELDLWLVEELFKLAKPAHLSIQAVEAKNLQLDLNQLTFSLTEDIPVQMDMSLKSDYFQAGLWSIRDLDGTISSDDKGVLWLKTKGDVQYLDIHSPIRRYLGEQPKVEITTSLVNEEERIFQMPDLKILITNPKDQIELTGHVHTRLAEAFHYGAVVHSMLQPETLERWGLDFKAHSLVKEPLDIRISFTPSVIPLSGPLLNQILNGGEIKIKKIAFTADKPHHIKAFESVVFPWTIDGHKNKATLRYKSYIVYDNDTPTHKMRLHANFYHWLKDGKIDFDHLAIDVGATLPNVPIDLLEMVTGVKRLDHLFGETLNINLKGNIDPENASQGHLDFNLSGERFKARAKLAFGDTISLIDKNDQATLEWVVNQTRFESLMSMINQEKVLDNSLTIQEKATINLTLSDLSIPWKGFYKGSLRTSLAQLAANIDLSIKNLRLIDKKSGKSANYNNIEGKFQTKALSEVVSFSLRGDGLDRFGKNPFSLLFDGKFDHLFNENDSFNLPGVSITFDALLQKAPLTLLTQFFYPYHELHHQIEALLGDSVDGSIHTRLDSLHGSIDSHLSGAQGKLSFAGTIANGILSLYQPLEAEVNVSPKLGSSVLRYFNPLLSTAQSSDQPIRVKIENGGFSLPLHPWKLNEINMSEIVIEIGKLKFKNNGEIGQVLSILNYKAKENEDINVWILPIHAAIKQGKIKIDRIDMLLVDTFPIAIWGSADLPDNKLRMIIGLTPVALNNAFNIRGLPKGSLLQLPLRGTLEKASLDTKSASTQIASLIAHAQGPQGVIIGSVIDILSGRGEKKVPPSRTEVPWKTDLPEDKNPSTIQKSGKFLEKQAENVIKKLFK